MAKHPCQKCLLFSFHRWTERLAGVHRHLPVELIQSIWNFELVFVLRRRGISVHEMLKCKWTCQNDQQRFQRFALPPPPVSVAVFLVKSQECGTACFTGGPSEPAEETADSFSKNKNMRETRVQVLFKDYEVGSSRFSRQ